MVKKLQAVDVKGQLNDEKVNESQVLQTPRDDRNSMQATPDIVTE